MNTRILVPLDGSELAERAIPYAEALARPSGARLILVRVVHRFALPGTRGATQMEAIRTAEEYLEEVAARLRVRDLVVDTAAPTGDPAEWIVDEAGIYRADLIVMATHGRGGLARFVYGSVASAVLTRATTPVLLVRAWQCEAASRFDDRPRLLVPLDGSDFAQVALDHAERLATELDGELVLLCAVPPLVPERLAEWVDGADLDAEQAAHLVAARDYLAQLAARLGKAGLPVQIEAHVSVPAEAIVAASREQGAALVVMATHARTGAVRLLLGSVAEAVIRQGEAPVLLVRPTVREVTRPAPATVAAQQVPSA